jgi:hypothetical protein
MIREGPHCGPSSFSAVERTRTWQASAPGVGVGNAGRSDHQDGCCEVLSPEPYQTTARSALVRGKAGNPHTDSSHVVRRTPLDIDIGTIQPIVALAAGILILLAPRLLNYIVAIYLIIIGVTGLIN